MKNLRLLLSGVCLVLLLASTQGYGQLYKWTDANGNVHYGDSPPEDAKLEQIKGEVSSYRSVTIEPGAGAVSGNTAKTVVMYSTSWCGYCRKAAHYFRKNNIPFSNRDIEKSERAAKEYEKLNATGVPVIFIGKQRMNGFRADLFEKIYYGNS